MFKWIVGISIVLIMFDVANISRNLRLILEELERIKR